MDVIIQIALFLLTAFNLLITFKEGKKIYNFYKEKYKRRIELKEHILNQKSLLNKTLGNLNLIKLKRPLRAKFTEEEGVHFNGLMDKIKLENTDLYLFIDTLLEFINKEDIRVFINRVDDLVINYLSLKEIKYQNGGYTAGTYNGQENRIKIYFDKNNSVLDHELLHAASSGDKNARVGFSLVFEKAGMFGEGLNEGYTELLNQRIFNHINSSYPYLTVLAELIENFYENKDDMMKDFFHADLLALISELLKSMSLEEAIDIITSMDLFLYQNEASFMEFVSLRQKIMQIYERRFILDDSKGEKRLVKQLFKKTNNVDKT